MTPEERLVRAVNSDPMLVAEYERRLIVLETKLDNALTALQEVHDRSLLPFDDNDRRWISQRCRDFPRVGGSVGDLGPILGEHR